MIRFNQFLILLALLAFFSCVRLAIADPCDNSSKNLNELNGLSYFLKQTQKHPEYVYHYNGVSVTAEEYERLMLQKHDKTQDPNMRLP